jgi:hypothetical protein
MRYLPLVHRLDAPGQQTGRPRLRLLALTGLLYQNEVFAPVHLTGRPRSTDWPPPGRPLVKGMSWVSGLVSRRGTRLPCCSTARMKRGRVAQDSLCHPLSLSLCYQCCHMHASYRFRMMKTHQGMPRESSRGADIWQGCVGTICG